MLPSISACTRAIAASRSGYSPRVKFADHGFVPCHDYGAKNVVRQHPSDATETSSITLGKLSKPAALRSAKMDFWTKFGIALALFGIGLAFAAWLPEVSLKIGRKDRLTLWRCWV